MEKGKVGQDMFKFLVVFYDFGTLENMFIFPMRGRTQVSCDFATLENMFVFPHI